MKIALLTYSTKPRGGVVHTLALAEALVDLDVEVDVWTLGRDGDQAFFRPVDPRVGVRVATFEALPDEAVGDRILRSIDVLRAAFARADYEIVHAQDCISANAVGRCVRTVHHLDRFSTPELAACHERAIVEPYAHVCVSDAVARELRAGWGIDPTVIVNGVDAARFATAAERLRTEGLAAGLWRRRLGDYVLAVGGIEPRKGSHDLLRGFARLRRRRPDLELVFAGGETLFDYRDYRAEFDTLAAGLGVDPIVLGPVEDAELPELVASARAFGFVSTKEGFGLAAMEALAAGVGVVVRDLPVFREVFGDRVRYATTPEQIGEALLVTLDQGPLPGGQAFAATHSWARAARAHLDFYDRLLTGSVRYVPDLTA